MERERERERERGGIKPRSLIQVQKTLLVKPTKTYNISFI